MFCNSFGGICRANRVKKIRIRKNTIKNIAPQAGMYRRRGTSREKRRRRRQKWRKPSRFSMKGEHSGGKTQSKATRSDAAAIVFALRKGYSSDIT